jgi:hypothetical protein
VSLDFIILSISTSFCEPASMSLALKIYEAFKDNEQKAKVLSEVIDDLERRSVSTERLATKDDLEITRLTLQKEIEEVRKQTEEVRLTLQKQIEEVRLTLQKEISEVYLSLGKEIEVVRSSIIKWVAGLVVVQTGVLVAVITLLR